MTTRPLLGWKKMTNYGLKLHIEQKPFPKVMLGFDLGQSYSGVAISSSDLRHAYVSIETLSI